MNCEKLIVPTINTEVWKSLPVVTRRADLKLAMVQRAVVKATAALANSTQQMRKASAKGSLTHKSVKVHTKYGCNGLTWACIQGAVA